MFLQYSTKYVITQIVITKSVNTFCVLYKVEEMTGVINEEQNTALPCIGVLYFTPSPDASRYL